MNDTEHGPGCCASCNGYGGGTYGPCWDCRGTGCAHPDPCPLLPAAAATEGDTP